MRVAAVSSLIVLLLVPAGSVWSADWTVIEGPPSDGTGPVVRERGSLDAAQTRAAEQAAATKEAASREIPRSLHYPQGEKDWTVLESDRFDGQSRVVRERATVEEAEAAAVKPEPADVRIVPHMAGGDLFYLPEIGPTEAQPGEVAPDHSEVEMSEAH